MAVRKLKDDEGNTYDVEIPDTDAGGGDEDDDPNTIYLDEEDLEWLKRKRLEEAEASRTSQKTPTKTDSSAGTEKVVKIRAKQKTPSTASRSEKTSRVRTLRLA